METGVPADLVLDADELWASVLRDDFFEFLKAFWSTVISEPPKLNWHVEFLCRQLQEVAERVIRGLDKEYDLIINIPPGSTKSTICSQMFPAWVWTRFPQAKFICGSYSHQVALKDSLKTRDILQSNLYRRLFPYVRMREDENTKGLFTNTMTGFRLSVGVGGSATGYHGHFLIVDDPINPEESFSEPQLKAATRWIRQTLLSRKIDQRITPLILIQQRLHQYDPSGELLESHGSPIRHICLPGELTDNVKPPELRRFYVDGLLDPVRLPRRALEVLREEMGPYGYAAQILQDPVPLGGTMFEIGRLLQADDPPSDLVRTVRAWDKASTTAGGAYSVGVKMGLDPHGKYWVLDVRRGQWSPSKREAIIRQTAEEDGVDTPIVIELEGGSGGKESGQNTASNLAGFRVHLVRPTGDKESRAYPFSSQVGAGNVYVLRRPWTRDFVEELRTFPSGRYKDQVDAASLAFNFLAKKPRKVGGLW